MPTQRLVLDADDKGRFFLSVQDGTLLAGPAADQADTLFRNLRVLRIHCEVEVEADPALQPGQPPAARGAQVRIVGTAAGPRTPVPPTTGSTDGLANRRLVVIDGADLHRSFALPVAGSVTVGTSQKAAGVVLHDLYVARQHCKLEVEDDTVTVTHLEGARGTLINGERIAEPRELNVGDIVRVGNSHLRFELGVGDIRPGSEAGDGRKSDAEALLPKAGSGQHPVAPPSPLDGVTKLANQVVGQYQLADLISRGPVSVLFRARHRQTNLAATVEVFSPEYPRNDGELQGFVAALKVIGPLRHPHLIPLLGAGKAGTSYWIAREDIEGESVAAILDSFSSDGKPSWKRACRVAIHVGKVLEFLASHRLWPGNLGPGNVLIEPGTRIVRLAAVLTAECGLLSELPYRAPELLEAGTRADGRAALYSLGAILYALLTGTPPYRGESPAGLLTQIRKGDLAKPSKSLRETPGPFEAAVLKLLEADPEDRFASASDLLAVVEPIAYMHEIKV